MTAPEPRTTVPRWFEVTVVVVYVAISAVALWLLFGDRVAPGVPILMVVVASAVGRAAVWIAERRFR